MNKLRGVRTIGVASPVCKEVFAVSNKALILLCNFLRLNDETLSFLIVGINATFVVCTAVSESNSDLILSLTC